MEKRSTSSRPFLRWVGGKSWLVDSIVAKLPKSLNNYHEPFLGSGSFFIKLKSELSFQNKCFLNDSNFELINAFRQLKNNPLEVCKLLRTYRNNELFYYQVRKRTTTDKISRASEFIFLNRTCYNGLYRVNLSGEFNVPYGFKKYKILFDYENILQVHDLLKRKVVLTSKDFFDTLDNVSQGDLVFIDPPYTVNHEHNGFIKYNDKIFSWEDQIRLKRFISGIIEREAYFILTNAAHESIYQLFGSISKPILRERWSLIGGKRAMRGPIHEYIFSNCLGK